MASSMLGQTPELPKIKKEETIVDKILTKSIKLFFNKYLKHTKN